MFLLGSATAAAAATAAIGLQFPWRRILPQNAPEARRRTMADVDFDTTYDVCIIGSGPAGAALGRDLVNQGLRTIILESGFDMLNGDPDPRLANLDVYRSVGPVDYPVASTRVRSLGGTSNMWTGRCSRLHPIDFARNAYTPADAAWPITYTDLEPYYDRAEETLRVRGSRLTEYHAPRQQRLPLRSRHDYSGLRALMRTVGITVDEAPTSTSRWVAGPVRAVVDILPDFTASDRATLVTGVTATQLLANEDGAIRGVEIQNLDREKQVVRARTYVVACGGIESARLLLLSRSDAFPHGIGNHYDRVGRYFTEHFHVQYLGTIPNIPHRNQYARTHQFYDQFKREGLGSAILTFAWRNRERDNLQIAASLEMFPTPQQRIMLAPDRLDYFGNPGVDVWLDYTEKDRETAARTRAVIQQIYADLGASELRAVADSGHNWGHHHIGTCPMGADPATSVVDANLRVHDSPNLYILSSATFVTSGPGHPTLAIIALAHRLAEHLTETASGFQQMSLRSSKMGRV